jgi:predicted DNA-binding transcriptional regulator AlpA
METATASKALPAALVQFDKLPDSAHVRVPTVAALNDVTPVTIWRWVREGRFPAPVKLGPNVTAWRVGDLRKGAAE